MMCFFSLILFAFFPYFRFSVEKNKKKYVFFCSSLQVIVGHFPELSFLFIGFVRCEQEASQTHSFLYAYYAIFPAEKSSEDFLLSSLSDDISLTRLHMHKLIHGRINKYYYHFYHTYPVIIELLL